MEVWFREFIHVFFSAYFNDMPTDNTHKSDARGWPLCGKNEERCVCLPALDERCDV